MTTTTTLTCSDVEIARYYAVDVTKPDRYMDNDDGTAVVVGDHVTYEVFVELRYPPRKAAGRPAMSPVALAEAARRACKKERRDFHTTGALYAGPEGVRFLREREVPARDGVR